MKQLTHLSLFSGIGGLDLAAEWAGFTTIGQCEFADYPYKTLQKHWPDVPKWRDIHDLSAADFVRRTGIDPGQLDCISGGFPCQPHSVAGKRKASADERDLWPEYRRVIDELKPRWVVAENVRGLLSSENGRFFRNVIRDFANMGYDVGWCCFRAADVGAIHARERIAIVAYDYSKRQQCWSDSWKKRFFQINKNGSVKKNQSKRDGREHGTIPDDNAYSYYDKFGLQRRMLAEKQEETNEQLERIYIPLLRRSDAHHLSESAILRKSDGVPHRVDRLKCLGNAVVPQQFYPIFKAIAEIERMIEE